MTCLFVGGVTLIKCINNYYYYQFFFYQISLQLFSTHATSCPKRPHRTIPRELKPHTSQCIPKYEYCYCCYYYYCYCCYYYYCYCDYYYVFSPGPNRATFTCPVCCLANLDCVGLRDHCNEQHSSVKIKAVSYVINCFFFLYFIVYFTLFRQLSYIYVLLLLLLLLLSLGVPCLFLYAVG